MELEVAHNRALYLIRSEKPIKRGSLVTKPCRNVHIPLATFISNQSFRVQVAMIRTQFNLDRAQFELLVGKSASSEFVMCFKDGRLEWS